MLHWIVFSTLAAGLLYGLYCLTLRRDRWLQLSRVYLISTLAFSLILPFLRLPQSIASGIASTPGLRVIYGNEVIITPDGVAENTIDMIPIVWMFGLILTISYLIFQLLTQAIHLLALRRKYPVYRVDDGYNIPRGAKLILPPDDTAPYSFFNQIVIGAQDLDSDGLQCILAHESHHVRQLHSVDLLVMRLLCCLNWFNPFAWMMLRELQAVHEYQADTAAINRCGDKQYLHLLYRQVTGIGYGHITNNFLSINIKKRIVMMNKKKTRFGAWKAMAALPVAAVLMMVGCQQSQPDPTDNPSEPATETAQAMPAIEDTICATPEVDPQFPGGIEALYKYLAGNIHYPQEARDNHISGRVFVRFVVEKDGSIADAEVLRGIGGGCDEEALRVVEAMPKWKPGMQSGKPVRVQFNLPIVFQLQQ